MISDATVTSRHLRGHQEALGEPLVGPPLRLSGLSGHALLSSLRQYLLIATENPCHLASILADLCRRVTEAQEKVLRRHRPLLALAGDTTQAAALKLVSL